MKSTFALAALACSMLFGVPYACGGEAAAPAVVARIDGAPLYASTFEAMLHELPADQATLPRRQLLDRMIADRLLARWARASFTEAERYPGGAVGFARDVAQDDQLVALLRRLHRQELEASLPRDALPGAVFTPAPALLEKVFGRPRVLRLDYVLGAEQVALAQKIVLLRATVGPRPLTLSVHQVLRRQNVQGRMEFFNHNVDFMQQQARAYAASLAVLDWAARRYGAQPLADLRQTLADRDDVRAAMTLYGVLQGAEAQSALPATLARKVTQAEIDVYYQTHKEQFRRVERVRARHMRVATEAMANALAAAAAAGQDFAALARRHSLAPDARRGGDLGWVVASPDPDWLSSLALMQPEGEVSKPFRAPVAAGAGAHWEILLVDRRVEGFHAATSETVRYQASSEIAHSQAAAQLAAAREHAVRSASIEITP